LSFFKPYIHQVKHFVLHSFYWPFFIFNIEFIFELFVRFLFLNFQRPVIIFLAKKLFFFLRDKLEVFKHIGHVFVRFFVRFSNMFLLNLWNFLFTLIIFLIDRKKRELFWVFQFLSKLLLFIFELFFKFLLFLFKNLGLFLLWKFVILWGVFSFHGLDELTTLLRDRPIPNIVGERKVGKWFRHNYYYLKGVDHNGLWYIHLIKDHSLNFVCAKLSKMLIKTSPISL